MLKRSRRQAAKLSKIIALLLIIILTASIVTPLFPLVKGQTLTYGGVDQNVYDPPQLSFSIANSAVLYDLGNFNFGLVAYVGSPVESQSEPDDLQTLGFGVCSVSYTASWEGNQPIELYNVSLATPQFLTGGFSGITTSLQSDFFSAIDLTHVPIGAQQITVSVVGGGYIWGGTEYSTFYTYASSSVDFTIKSAPSSLPAQNSTLWNLQTVNADGEGELGPGGNTYAVLANCPIAVNSENNTQIAYTDNYYFTETYGSKFTASIPIVMYAGWNGFSWSTQAVAVGNLYSLVLEANDTPHLVFSGSAGLTYATRTGLNWTYQTVDPNGASFAALAFDSAGNPYIAYDNGATIKYASWTGSSWQIQTVDTLVKTVVGQIYLALTQSNIPYIMYGYSSPINGAEVVQLAIRNNTGWNIQTISLQSPISGFGNMVLDSKGYPHFITAQANVNNTEVDTLFYVSWNGTGWTAQKVTSNIPLQINAPNTSWMYIGSVALDAKDNPHITYTSNGYVMYASWTGKSWKVQFVQTATGYVGSTEPGFLALDSSGDPHLSFYGSVVSYYGYANMYSIVDVMYATAKEPVSPSVGQKQPFSMPNQLIIIIIAVITAVVAISLLLYRRNSKKASKRREDLKPRMNLIC